LGPLALLFTPMLLFDSSQLRYLFDLASMCVSQILSCCCLASLVTSFGNLVFPPHLLFTSLGTMRLDPPLSCFFMYDFQTMLVILCYFVWMLMFLFHLFWWIFVFIFQVQYFFIKLGSIQTSTNIFVGYRIHTFFCIALAFTLHFVYSFFT
jgi:hypothetical protein